MKKISVFLVDDQVLFVDSLKNVLNTRAKDITVIGVAYNGKTAVEQVDRLKPDIVLMDVRMPIMDGVECTRIIKERSPDTHVMMLTTFDDDEYVLEAMEIGAVGYLLKNIHPSYLIHAIRSVFQGGVIISPQIARKLMNKEKLPLEKEKTKSNLLGELSNREREVLLQLSDGLSNREIAEKLFIAEQTVKSLIGKILEELGAGNRAHAVYIAMKRGIIE